MLNLPWSAEADVDLLVVGTHQRSGLARFLRGSVAGGVLDQALCNVVCVPRLGTVAERDIPTFRHVLIPTDFSALANQAIPVGYGLVAAGGVVHLLHVITQQPGEAEPTLERRLRALIPPGASARGVTTEIELAREDAAGMGIWHAVERLGADAVCMATHWRSGLSRVLLGSQAQELMQRARVPVLPPALARNDPPLLSKSGPLIQMSRSLARANDRTSFPFPFKAVGCWRA